MRHTLVVVRQTHETEAPQMYVRSGPLLAATQLATEKATSRVLRLFVLLHVYAKQYASRFRAIRTDSESPGGRLSINPCNAVLCWKLVS